MQENPAQYERYKKICRKKDFGWQYRNGTLNKYESGEGRFSKAVRKHFDKGIIDREIARKLNVSYEVVRRITKVWRKSAAK